ncbi:MAG: FAD binding domain-containing protein [Chloroflexi bacterium]|nr:FAD binding domain-containing protein [Chloroflexota bacterium]
MHDFEYLAPTTLAAAVAALAMPGARPLAGGTDLIPQLREGRRRVARVVDLKRIPDLVAITPLPAGGVRIGAATSATAVAAHAAIAHDYLALVETARLIGSYQIQNRASLGGNVCNAAPSADAAPVLICLGAQAEVAGPGGRRTLPLEELFAGAGQTILAPGELLAALVLPLPAARSAATYVRFTPRNEMDIAIAGAGAWLRLADDGTVAAARIALAAVAPTPLRVPEAEQALLGQRPTATLLAETGRLAARAARPISDTRGSAEYRRELAKVLTARALAACCAQLGLTVEVA